MIKLQIESTEIIDKDFPKKGAVIEGRWYIRNQPILLFKSGSKYPDKGYITLAFTDIENERNTAETLQKGDYELIDDAYYFDRNGNMCLSFKSENLRLVSASKAV